MKKEKIVVDMGKSDALKEAELALNKEDAAMKLLGIPDWRDCVVTYKVGSSSHIEYVKKERDRRDDEQWARIKTM